MTNIELANNLITEIILSENVAYSFITLYKNNMSGPEAIIGGDDIEWKYEGQFVFYPQKTVCEITGEHNFVKPKATFGGTVFGYSECSICYISNGFYEIPGIDTVNLSKSTYTYDGKVKKPNVIVKDVNGNTIDSENYTVKYASGRKNVGSYKVTVTFKNDYYGSITKTFKINPKGTTLSSLSKAKKAFTVKWKKRTTQVTGYQIQYATNKKFNSAKKVTVTSNKTDSKKITGLKAKKTYYVRIRTYKTVNGTKYYSGWSSYKTVKTK